MDYRSAIAQGAALSQVKADALVLVLAPEHSGTANVTLDRLVQAAIDSGDFALKAGRSLYLHQPANLTAPRLVLVASANAQTNSLKAAVAKGVAALKDSAAAHIAVAFADGLVSDAEAAVALAQAAVLAVADASYVFRDTKPSAPKPSALKKITMLHADAVAAAVKSGLAQGEAIAEGVTLARHLGNLPANHCTPTHLAAQARKLGKAHKHVAVQVLERPALEKLGMGSFLSVTNGSAEPPKFIVLRYEGGSSGQAPVVLVGKGITFDTGGISLKPGAGMDEMKFDMGGAASVLGTFESLARLKPKLNVIGLIPTCENMPSGTATKPGDVVTSMSGQTIEVLNTDAEGRLILCDALTYAERFKPAVVVDIATLTGACVIALGNVHSGLFSGDDELAQALLDAGQTSLDSAWRLPLDEEYGESLKSNFADMGNVGGREGGAITAAVFLSKFTKAYRWAHLDIAGTAWKSGGAKGGTGRPVGLLTQFLLDQAAAGKAALQPKAAAKAPGKTAGKAAGKAASEQASAKSTSTQGAGAKRATAKAAPQA